MERAFVVSPPRGAPSLVRGPLTLTLLLAIVALVVASSSLVGCGRRLAGSVVAPDAHGALRAGRADLAGGGALKLDGAGHLEGTLGPEAVWSIDRPDNWNGDLVVWLHGYTNPAAPIALPAFGPVRDAFLAQGYAVVASSYSANGFAVKEGMTQSHQLRGLFVSRVGQPRRTYLVGVSLGGLVGALLQEKFPDQYDGSLLVSGVVAGADDELRYVGDTRVLFDAVYPGVLPGSLYDVPPGTNVNAAIGAAVAAIQAHPQGVGVIYALSRVKPEFSNSNELVTSILSAIGFQLQGAGDLLARTHGHSFFDNEGWTYTGPVPQVVADQVNATVARYAPTPDALAYLSHYGEPSGNLTRPVIALHDRWDPVVPSASELSYAAAVASQGANNFLLQRSIIRYGHVAVLPSEFVANLNDLAHWVDTGLKPAN